MKKLILLTFFVSSLAFGQNTNKFSTIGTVEHDRSVDKYIALIVISEDLAYNNYDSPQTYDQLKTEYFNKLKNNNVNTDLLKENKELYFQYGYRKKGSTFEIATSNKEDFMNVLAIGADGVNIYEKSVEFKPLSATEVTELSIKALADAKERAEIVAAASGKKIGNMLELNHKPYGNSGGFYNKDYAKQSFMVSVVYELLD